MVVRLADEQLCSDKLAKTNDADTCVVDAVAATSCSATLEANDLRSAMQPRWGAERWLRYFFLGGSMAAPRIISAI